MLEKKLYTARATASGGRNGKVKSDDGVIDLEVKMPKALGGEGGPHSNPEQLFAAGYSACFDSALQLVARNEKVKMDSTVTAEVSIGPDQGGFGIGVDLHIKIEGVEKEKAQELVEKAHQVCPYSKATRDNIPVSLTVV